MTNEQDSKPYAIPDTRLIEERGYSIRVEVLVDEKKRTVWIPKSMIDDDSEVFDTDHAWGTLIIPTWLAQDRGLL